MKRMLNTEQAARERPEEAAAVATRVLEATEHRMNKEKAAKEAIQTHLDAGQKIREGLQRELSASEGSST